MKLYKIIGLGLMVTLSSSMYGMKNWLPRFSVGNPIPYLVDVFSAAITGAINKQGEAVKVVAEDLGKKAIAAHANGLDKQSVELQKVIGAAIAAPLFSGIFGVCGGLGLWYFLHKIKKCSQEKSALAGLGVLATALLGGMLYYSSVGSNIPAVPVEA